MLAPQLVPSRLFATSQLQRQAGIPCGLPASQHSSRPCRRRAVRSYAASSASSFDPSSNSISYPYDRQQFQSLQQQRQQPRQQGPQQRSGEETDLLWAGYSALDEQVQSHHKRHDALVNQIQELQAKLHAVQQQQPASLWSQASFLLFFLFFINCWGWIASFQTMGWGWPWVAAKTAPVGAIWTKQLLGVAVPLTNTLVVLIFCLQAIKAAWTVLKW